MTTRLTKEQMVAAIDDAIRSFPALALVVFSGGEVTLLKEDLYDSIAHATSRNLLARCVSNGGWAKTTRSARNIAQKFKAARITEMNLSTGSDHQEWVPFTAIEHAAEALTSEGIPTLVTVESDGEASSCVQAAKNSAVFAAIKKATPHLLSIQQNVWMPFNQSFDDSRGPKRMQSSIYDGCTQLFTNLAVTPHHRLSSCCGLTFEHIPEMKLGNLAESSMKELALAQIDDFLKIWIAVDGPATIMKRLLGEETREQLKDVHHICHACALMYKHPEVKALIRKRAHEFVPEILSRFNLSVILNTHHGRPVAQAQPEVA